MHVYIYIYQIHGRCNSLSLIMLKLSFRFCRMPEIFYWPGNLPKCCWALLRASVESWMAMGRMAVRYPHSWMIHVREKPTG